MKNLLLLSLLSLFSSLSYADYELTQDDLDREAEETALSQETNDYRDDSHVSLEQPMVEENYDEELVDSY